jgi:hypothetical protein
MVLCFACTLVCLDRLVDEFDAWRASRPVVPEPVEPVVPAWVRREADRFTRTHVVMTKYGDRRRRTPILPVPPDNTLELAEVSGD